jgi:two-component system chemotaxis sensor kinase CheA
LEERGFEVIACEDGQIAWEQLLGNNCVDLVVTDVEMPNMSGLELSKKIKSNPALRHIPVIALTSLAGEEDIQRGRQCGVDDYQVKMDREKLNASVSRLLSAAAVQNHNRQGALELSEAGI